jgi:hypothetical protein
MTTFNTGNPVGSNSPQDLFDNAENLDLAMNDQTALQWIDRLGGVRKSWHKMESDINSMIGSVLAGISPRIVISTNNIVLPEHVGFTLEINSTDTVILYAPDEGSYNFPDGALIRVVNFSGNYVAVTPSSSKAAILLPPGKISAITGANTRLFLQYRKPFSQWFVSGDLLAG